MKLSRTSSGDDIVMDMTPMIDVVFQLIIFFMLLMDMTTKDLEELKLPKAVSAVEDIPEKGSRRPVLNITSDGRILVKAEVYYDPAHDDGYFKLKGFLVQAARRMPTAHVTPGDPSSAVAPDKPILIRADQSTPFKHVQKVMEFCGLTDIKIWKIEFAASEAKTEEQKNAEAAAAARGDN